MDSSFKNIFFGKTVIITGHTGFKGTWLTSWLFNLGARIIGISLEPKTTPSFFKSSILRNQIIDNTVDIRNLDLIREILCKNQPDFVFHLAAQSLVRESFANPIETWQTNLVGTVNILESLRALKNKCYAVIVTSDKCYKNIEQIKGYIESDEIGGFDPYSASKGAAELAIRSYANSFFKPENEFVKIASARAGNVIGGGDWSENRIIPDCIRSWSKNQSVKLRHPLATRPWQHVLEPLSGYLTLAQKLKEGANVNGEAYNFGPSVEENHTVSDLVVEMSNHWPAVQWTSFSDSESNYKESGLLQLNCDKARNDLNWHSTLTFEETVGMTAEWYKKYYDDRFLVDKITNQQIEKYTKLATERGLKWTK